MQNVTPKAALFENMISEILHEDAFVNESLYRGDSRVPSTIFEKGFKSVGIQACIVEHVYGPSGKSMYVSTATTLEAAMNFP